MSRAKSRRPGTRGGGGNPIRRVPSDIADAAEAALDDLLTQARDRGGEIDGEDDEVKTTAVPHTPKASAPRLPPPPPPPARTVRDSTPPPLPRPPSRDSTPPPPPQPRAHRESTPPPPPQPRAHRESTPPLPAQPRAPSAAPLGQLVDESGRGIDSHVLPELPTLRFAIYEDPRHLASAQGAIVAAGHVVVVGGAGSDAVTRAIEAVRSGSIDVVLVALPGGEPIIEAAHALEPRRPVVIATLSTTAVEAVSRAAAAGADLVMMRPHDVERLAPILLAASRLQTERRLAMTARGAEQVLRSRLEELSDPGPRGLLPFEMFQRVLELELKRAKRFEYPLSVALFAVEIAPPPPPPGIRGILRARAGNALINTIRDIDIATQLDQERFLVLLPYTDLKGSAGLGRRVIAAVASGDPVIAAGRSFPPRVVGAVTGGASASSELSFAKLMKNATRALEQARRDGAELAVQP